MRMPPFMRQSNALPLTLAAWQYDLTMRWADAVAAAPAQPGTAALVAPQAPVVGLVPSDPAFVRDSAARRAAVLARATGTRP